MTLQGVTPRAYEPQDTLYVWTLVNPAAPVLTGSVALSPLVPNCATFTYAADWWEFALSENLPLVTGQMFSAGVKDSAPGAIDDARPDRWGERIIRHIDRPARLSILEMLLFAGDDRFGALGISTSAEHYVPRRIGPIRSCAIWPRWRRPWKTCRHKRPSRRTSSAWCSPASRWAAQGLRHCCRPTKDPALSSSANGMTRWTRR